MTVLGYSSIVKETLNISDVVIDTNLDGCYIAAVSVQPFGESNVIVNNLKVTLDDEVVNYNGGIGGLYQQINKYNLQKIGEECYYTNKVGNMPTGVPAGIVAGVFNLTLDENIEMTIPYAGPSQAFGKVNVTVGNNSNSDVFLKVNKANKSTPDNCLNWSYTGSSSTGNYTFYVTAPDGI